MNADENQIRELLKQYKKITVLGLSPDTSKPSHQIPLYMKNHGYDVVGVYPKGDVAGGMKLFPSLTSVPAEQRRFINVFRRSENIPEVVDEVLALGGCDFLWLQLGITHPEAEKKAEAVGLKVVSNMCLMVEHRKLLGGAR